MIPATRVLLSVFLLSTIALAQSRVERNIVYGMYSGTALLMDVHYPVNANGVGVIFVPGSGWSADTAYGAARAASDWAKRRFWFTIEARPPEALSMLQLTRITRDPAVMGGKPCIRGMRVTVGTVVGLVAAGHTRDEILCEYPYLEADDIAEALSYAAWRAEEVEVPLR
jgi:uncharacterized protein (DUF433 family)